MVRINSGKQKTFETPSGVQISHHEAIRCDWTSSKSKNCENRVFFRPAGG